MEMTEKLGVAKKEQEQQLLSIAKPQNAILTRLQNFCINKKDDRVVCGYSRMHNRHNRS